MGEEPLSSLLRSLERRVHKFRTGRSLGWVEDQLAIEEPLEIRLEYGPETDRQALSIAITMRTPGHDPLLALGFLLTEGVIQSCDQVLDAQGCGPRNETTQAQNIVKVLLKPGVDVDAKHLTRHVFTTSSCGICGKASLDAVRSVSHLSGLIAQQHSWLTRDCLQSLPERLRHMQQTFALTGGLHAAALFDADANAIAAYEDVGRHNAVDKLIGHLLRARQLPPEQHILLVSGRASFELVQKAAMAGIPCLAAIGAPSSLAVDLAEEFGMALVGFLKSDRLNLYTGAAHFKD